MRRLIVCLLITTASAMASPSQEGSAILPQAYPIERYQSVWQSSPFLREVVAVKPMTLSASFGKSLVLVGLVDDMERGPIAYVRDQREERTFVVTKEGADDHGYVIISADQKADPRESSVTLTDGNETARIKYLPVAFTSGRNPAQPQNQAQGQPQQRAVAPPQRAVLPPGTPAPPREQPATETRVGRRRVVLPPAPATPSQ